MKFKPVSVDSFEKVYEQLKQAFPYEERRDMNEEKELLKIDNFYFDVLESQGKVVGLAAYWKFDDFIYLEHLAINSEYRGQGFGTEFLKEITKLNEKPVILEVEPPTTAYAKKRIQFYQNSGYVLNGKRDYFQPTYHKDGNELLLYIMSSQDIDNDLVEKFVEITRKYCYQVG